MKIDNFYMLNVNKIPMGQSLHRIKQRDVTIYGFVLDSNGDWP